MCIQFEQPCLNYLDCHSNVEFVHLFDCCGSMLLVHECLPLNLFVTYVLLKSEIINICTEASYVT